MKLRTLLESPLRMGGADWFHPVSAHGVSPDATAMAHQNEKSRKVMGISRRMVAGFLTTYLTGYNCFSTTQTIPFSTASLALRGKLGSVDRQ